MREKISPLPNYFHQSTYREPKHHPNVTLLHPKYQLAFTLTKLKLFVLLVLPHSKHGHLAFLFSNIYKKSSGLTRNTIIQQMMLVELSMKSNVYHVNTVIQSSDRIHQNSHQMSPQSLLPSWFRPLPYCGLCWQSSLPLPQSYLPSQRTGLPCKH